MCFNRWWKTVALTLALVIPAVAMAAPETTALAQRVATLRGHIADLQRLSKGAGARDADARTPAELESDVVAVSEIAKDARDDVRGIRLRLFPNASPEATAALDSLDLSLGRAQDAFIELRTATRAGDPSAIGVADDSIANVSIDLENGFNSLLRALDSPQIAPSLHYANGAAGRK